MKDWIDKLQVKDPVAISGNNWNPPTLTHVQRLTKTLIITTGERRWNRELLYEVGSQGYNRARLMEWTKNIEEKIERAELEAWLCRLGTLVSRKEIKLTLDVLRKMRGHQKDGLDT